jgi:hypothetical protein
MSLEAWNTVFAGLTFAVITATAIAALVQLGHLRSSTQLQAWLAVSERWNDAELHKMIVYCRNELPAKVRTAKYQQAMRSGGERSEHPEWRLADYWEQIGAMVKYGFIIEGPYLDLASFAVMNSWDLLSPSIGLVREHLGPTLYENFEYLAARAKPWIDAHPNGTYPSTMQRLPITIPPPTG